MTQEVTPSTGAEVNEDAAMLAGFQSIAGGESVPATVEEPVGEPSTGDAVSALVEQLESDSGQEPQPQEDTPAADPWAAGLAETRQFVTDEVNRINQTIRNVAGNVGGLKSALQKLQSAPQGTAAADKAEELVKAAVEAHIGQEYPEMAPHLIKSLTALVSKLVVPNAPAPSVDADAIEQRVMTRVERRALERAHPKWEADLALKDETGQPVRDAEGKYVAGPAFREWIATKDAAFQKEFGETIDSEFLIDALGDFKAFRDGKNTPAPAPTPAPAGAPAPAPAPAPAAAQSNKQRRLAAAVTPTGVGKPATGRAQPTEEDDFVAGFRRVRGS